MNNNYDLINDNFAQDDYWMTYGGESQELETQLWEAEEF